MTTRQSSRKPHSSTKKCLKSPQMGHPTCKTTGRAGGHGLSWETATWLRLCTPLLSRQDRDRARTPLGAETKLPLRFRRDVAATARRSRWRHGEQNPVQCGASETQCSEDKQRRESLGFGGNNDVANLRYVDDTISLTCMYCRDCIVTRATMIYPSGIVSEPQPPGRPRHGLILTCTSLGNVALSLPLHDVSSFGSDVKVNSTNNTWYLPSSPSATWISPSCAE